MPKRNKRKKLSSLQKAKNKPNSPYWRRQADRLWSRYIKRRDGSCVICCGTSFLQAHHLISRSVGCLRHEPMNGVLLCAKNHKYDPRCSAHKGSVAFVMRLSDIRPDQIAWVMQHWLDDREPNYKEAAEKLTKLLNS